MSSIILPSDLLEDIPLERLKVLADKDEEFVTFFSQLDLEKMRDIQRKRDKVNNVNRRLSLENTERKPDYEEKKERLTNSCLLAAELNETYERKCRQLKSLTGATDRAALYKELQQAMKTAEKDSENLADNYLDRTIQLSSDEFTNQFLSQRCSYWSRKVKTEKMEVIMKQPLPYSVATPIPNPSTPYPPSQSMPSSVAPYPPGPASGPSPPSYDSLGPGTNPTQSVSASYRRLSNPPTQATPTSSMPMPQQWNYHTPQQQGFPQASYRPPPQGYRPAPPPVGQSSYPIYQQTPYYPNQYGRGYPPRR